MEQLPQIHSKTGISQDYFNEYNSLIVRFNRNDISKVVEIIKNTRIKTYEQRFPRNRYIHDYDEKIKRKIEALDELAKIINRDFTSESKFDGKRFKEIVNQAYEIVYGEGKKVYQ
jgi:hypothetical protein